MKLGIASTALPAYCGTVQRGAARQWSVVRARPATSIAQRTSPQSTTSRKCTLLAPGGQAQLVAASGTTRRLPRALSAPSLTRYDSLFSIEMARRQLKSDIENSIDQIKERLLATRLDPRTTTLRELVENELKPEVYGPEKCRDRALACRDRVGVSAWLPGPAPGPATEP